MENHSYLLYKTWEGKWELSLSLNSDIIFYLIRAEDDISVLTFLLSYNIEAK